MIAMAKISLDDVGQLFHTKNCVVIIGLGFDDRCLTALRSFPLESAVQIFGIANVISRPIHRSYIEEFNQISGDKGKIIGSESRSVIGLADEVVGLINNTLIGHQGSIVVDITSLSHELLVVILGALHSFDIMKRVTLLYVGASEYSSNTADNAVWLSRGVRSIRSVLGFPGTMLPSKRLHLIILAGFEVERASEVIIRYEPASLSIGVGHKDQSVSVELHKKNIQFFERLNQFVEEHNAETQEVLNFEFSCVDPYQTKQQLLAHIDGLPSLSDKNIVICPLNTKLSTVGVVLAALERSEIQICYAEPDEYNTDGYSKPGGFVTIVSLEES